MGRFTQFNSGTGQYEVLCQNHSIAIREEKIECDSKYKLYHCLNYVSGEIIDKLAAYENIGTIEEYERMRKEAYRYEQEQKELHRRAERKVVELQRERNKLHEAMEKIQQISGTLDYNGYV